MNIDKDIEIVKKFTKQIKTDKHYKNDNGWSGYYNTELKILSQAIENVLSELERKKLRIDNLKEENELQHCDLQNAYSINNGLKSELETYKKIAEFLADEGEFNSNKYCDEDGLVCMVKHPERECTKCIIDWARKEVDNDFE